MNGTSKASKRHFVTLETAVRHPRNGSSSPSRRHFVTLETAVRHPRDDSSSPSRRQLASRQPTNPLPSRGGVRGGVSTSSCTTTLQTPPQPLPLKGGDLLSEGALEAKLGRAKGRGIPKRGRFRGYTGPKDSLETAVRHPRDGTSRTSNRQLARRQPTIPLPSRGGVRGGVSTFSCTTTTQTPPLPLPLKGGDLLSEGCS